MLKTLEYPNIFSYSAPFLNTVGVSVTYEEESKESNEDLAKPFIKKIISLKVPLYLNDIFSESDEELEHSPAQDFSIKPILISSDYDVGSLNDFAPFEQNANAFDQEYMSLDSDKKNVVGHNVPLSAFTSPKAAYKSSEYGRIKNYLQYRLKDAEQKMSLYGFSHDELSKLHCVDIKKTVAQDKIFNCLNRNDNQEKTNKKIKKLYDKLPKQDKNRIGNLDEFCSKWKDINVTRILHRAKQSCQKFKKTLEVQKVFYKLAKNWKNVRFLGFWTYYPLTPILCKRWEQR